MGKRAIGGRHPRCTNCGWRPLGLVAACIWAAAPVWAQTNITWTGGTGFWNQPLNWNLNQVPDNGVSSYNVFINNVADDVSLNLSATVNRVNNTGILRLLNGFSLSLTQPAGLTNTGQLLVDHTGSSGLFGAVNNDALMWVRSGVLDMGGTMSNDGTIWLGNGSVAGGTTGLRFTDDFTLNGVGEIYFFSNAQAVANQPTMTVTAGNTLTNALGHRIHGGSGVITGAGRFENFGLIDADAPLRTFTLNTTEFYNAGHLIGQSGNLNVAVDDWTNAGVVRTSSGGISTFTGTLITNQTGAVIESNGGAQLQINQNLTNFGTVTSGSSGTTAIMGSNRLVINAPNAVMQANTGTLRFGSTNGYVQNFGTVRANEGNVVFENGMDMFGGTLALADNSRGSVTTGTTTLTQVRATIDATSELGVSDPGTGTSTFTFDGVMDNNGGRLFAFSDAGSTATFNLYGQIHNTNGTIQADGGDFNIGANNVTTRLASTGSLMLEIRNSGDIRFTNMDSAATTMSVEWTGTGGELTFSNYRPETSTLLNMAGWTADGGTFRIAGGSRVSATGRPNLAADTDLIVTDAGSRLTMNELTTTAAGSLVDLVSGGRLDAANLSVGGVFQFRGGTLGGNLFLQSPADFSLTTGSNRVTGNLGWQGDRDIVLSGGSTRLAVDGAMSIAMGSSLDFFGNSTFMEGAGVITNSGLIESHVLSSNNSVFLDSTVVNNDDGVIRAEQNGAAINTYLQIRGNVTNEGLMEASGANLYFTTGANVTNSGTIHTMDHAAGSHLYFLGGARMTDAGGATVVEGSASSLEISGASQVGLGALSVAGGAQVIVTDGNTIATASNVADIGAGTVMDVRNSSRFDAAGIDLDGQLMVRNSAVVNAPITVNPGGLITLNSGLGTVNGQVTVSGGGPSPVGGTPGRIELNNNGSQIAGTGSIINNGEILGGAPNTNNSTYLDKAVVSNPEGVIRAYQNGAATNTYLQVRGVVTNQGLMEAVGANLYFTGSNVTNSGTVRAVDHPAGSRLIFLGGATMANAGGATNVDGPASLLDVSGANIAAGALSLTDGADLSVSGGGTVLSATSVVDLGLGTIATIANSSAFNAAGIDLSGRLIVQNSAQVNGPVTVEPGGVITANSGLATFNGPVTVSGGGPSPNGGTPGRVEIINNGAQIAGTGSIVNSGEIVGGAPNTSNSTYLDKAVINNADGVIRAFQNGAATNTAFQIRGTVDNAGLMVGDAARLYMTGATITNRSAIETANNGNIEFVGGTRVTDAGGIILVNNGGTGIVSDNGTTVDADTTIDAGGQMTVANSSRLGGPHLQVDGRLFVQNSSRIEAPTTVGPGGVITANSSLATFNGQVTVEGAGSGGRIEIVGNSAQIAGTGTIINSGEIAGGAPNTNNSTFLDKAVVNTLDGVIRAFKNGAATGTLFQIRGTVDNAGLMVGDAARLYMPGATITNSGAIETANNGNVEFVGGTRVTDASGTILVNNGGTGVISDNGTSVDADTTIDAGGQMTVANSARLGGPHLQVDGRLFVQNSTRIEAPTTVSPTGVITANSGLATFNGQVTVEGVGPAPANVAGSGGRIEIVNNSAQIAGTGTIVNSGEIAGGAPNTNNSTFLDKAVVNTPDGVIRAFKNGAVTGTAFQIRGPVDNAGLMVGDASRLYMTGSPITNSGAIETANNGNIEFVNGTRVTDVGGTILVDNGGTGIVSDNGTIVDATTTIEQGGQMTVANSSRLGGPQLQVDGQLFVQNSARVDAPTTVGPTGLITANSSIATFNGDVTVEGGGPAPADQTGAFGQIRLIANGVQVNGTGVITNRGLIEGGAPNNNNHTYLDNIVNNTVDGTIRAFSNNGATGTTFHLRDNITNAGLLEANAAELSIENSFVDNTAGRWSAVNGGALSVSGSFVGGSSGSNTTIDGNSSSLQLSSASLVGFDTLNLTNGGDVSVSGINTSLAILSQFDVPVNSVATVSGNGRLQADGIEVAGTLAAQAGTIVSDVHLLSTGVISATSGTTTIDGNVTTTSLGSLVDVNGGTALIVDGTIGNVANATVRLQTNGTALSGDGLFTNAGLLRGEALNTSNTVTMTKDLFNSGVVEGADLGAATNTTFRLNPQFITNTGMMRASGAHLNIFGSMTTNSGTLRAENGNVFSISNSAQVFGGAAQGDGDASLFQVLSASNVDLNSLSLTNGGDVQVDNASLDVAMPFTAGTNSVVTVDSNATISGGGVQIDGTMQAGRGTVTAPVTIGPTGQMFVNSGSGTTFNAPVTVQRSGGNAGRVALLNSSSWMLGTGLLNNSGVVEAGAPGTNQSTYIYNNIVNSPAGVIRAFKSAAGTNTYLQLSSSITNNGVMEANGANLYFNGGSTLNSNRINAVSHPNGSRLIFLNSTQVNDIGGTSASTVDGAGSTIEVSGNADVTLATLTISNGAVGSVTGAGSTLSANTTLGAGSSLSVDSSALLGGPNAQINGSLTVAAATVAAPTVVGGTGVVTITGTGASGSVFNGAVTVNNGGTVTLAVDNARISGAGLITNNGLIRGGAATGSNSTFISNILTNNATGTVRAYRSAGSSATTFRLEAPVINNNGIFEADQATLRVGTNGLTNNGTIRTLNAGRFISDGPVNSALGSTIDFANGTSGDFNSSLISNGLLDLGNNTIDVDGSLTFGAGATLAAVPGATLRLGGSLSNASTQATNFNLAAAALQITGNVVTMEVAGKNAGPNAAGMIDNFALDALTISSGTILTLLSDTVDNQSNGANNEALYVDALTLSGGATQLFLNGLSLYYGSFAGNMSQVVLGGGTFQQIVGPIPEVPEPTTALLFAAGALAALGRRRRG